MPWSPGDPSIRALWTLDPEVVFLNHGSFGATPRRVLEAQTAWRARLEREPVLFLARDLPELARVVRERVATFLGADPAGLVPIGNATTGVATVLANLDWQAGDEIVLADSAYFAVKQACRALADRYGVRVVEAVVPFPIERPDQATAAFVAAMTERTRLVIVDHVVSALAIVLPVGEIVAAAHARGITVLVDGAHGPGQLPLDLDAIGADFYTGNLHKWVCSPKGTAILYAAAPWRDRLHPLAISHHYKSGLHAEFDWTGTTDPSAWLAVSDAMDVLAELGWDALRANNHASVQRGRTLVAEALGATLPHPDDPALYGSMAVIPVDWATTTRARPAELTARLYEQHRIEVPFTTYDERVWVRISGQAYNAPSDYARLAEVLRTWRG